MNLKGSIECAVAQKKKKNPYWTLSAFRAIFQRQLGHSYLNGSAEKSQNHRSNKILIKRNAERKI